MLVVSSVGYHGISTVSRKTGSPFQKKTQFKRKNVQKTSVKKGLIKTLNIRCLLFIQRWWSFDLHRKRTASHGSVCMCVWGCTFGPPTIARSSLSGMEGVREPGSQRQRPWSVYRANTFELSSEMIGLALAGERWPMFENSFFIWKKLQTFHFIWSVRFAGNIQDPDEPVLEFSVGEFN